MRADRSVATPPEGRPRVAGVILAAGLSSRLGRPKQLLDIAGEPLVRRIARIALQSQLDSVTVVVGNAAEKIVPRLGDLNVAIVLNQDFEVGQASSITAGIESLPHDADAVLFLLGDQPTVAPEVIDAVIDAFLRSKADVVQARYGDSIPGHPVLFSRALVPELMQLTGDEGGRSILLRHDVRYVDYVHEAPPDIDTEEDYQQVLNILNAPPEHNPKA
jgi:molybdenum cofactor cytidylyltransferase